MSTGSIGGLANSFLQSILRPQHSIPFTQTANSPANVSSLGQPDRGQLSPFAQILTTLQQLQQSDPAKYQQVTQQIATNLQDAAKTAQQNGNTTAADQLNQLAGDFSTASQNGQLPNIQDLAKAIGGHHGHHHHAQAADADGDNDGSGGTSAPGSTSSANSATSTANQLVSQLLAAYQSGGFDNSATDPAKIIFDTLSSSGIGGAQ